MTIRLCLIIFLITGMLTAQEDPYPNDYFQAPLDIPLRLSGTFGELRTNHFHSGVDFKTDQREGFKVRAAASGNVVRIKVSPYGFGRAIYVQHGNGFTTVYAHLQRFNDEIEAFVRKQQYAQKKFDIELYPEAGTFWVEKGEVIALSGNSGGSGAPHLHFEIRDTRTEKIINPLLFGFDIQDSQKPELYNLEVYEFDGDELMSSYTRKLLRENGNYSLSGTGLIEVSHLPAFGITAYDRLDGASNKNGVYCIELKIDEKLYYTFKMETFAFDESRYINSHIDYSQKICCQRNINKLYLDPGNRFSQYGATKHMNFPDLDTGKIYQVSIKVSDAKGNETTLNFDLKYTPEPGLAAAEIDPQVSVFRYNQSNLFKEENVQILLPDGALYNDVYFEYQRKEPCSTCYSFIHELASRTIPVHQYYTIRIKPNENFEGDKSKLCIASLEDGKIDEYEGGSWDNGYVRARTRQFGQFAVVADTISPTIKPVGFMDGGDVSSNDRLSFVIKDNFSGVDTYKPLIDGKWVLFDYDAKNDLIYTDLSLLQLEPGEHVLELEVKDKVGNTIIKNYHLIF